MQFESDNLYHIYNQGNNKQQIFFSHENYLYFLRCYRNLVLPCADTLAYCLMPNHFHFLVHTNESSIDKVKIGSLYLTHLSNGIRKCLSSYASAINKQHHTSGSLFRQKTKAELINNASNDYARTVFHYIHHNPLRAKMVNDLKDWEYSSFKDYMGLKNGRLINKDVAKKMIDVNWERFEKDTMEAYKNRI
jgi:REP element-mobilizing transposase RayT